jgi:G:T-mismatch repair DNA endonuclease (very short patch repair protein)
MPKAHRAFWNRKFELNVERDERKRRTLESSGWQVLEIWECQLKHDSRSCAEQVEGSLDGRASQLESKEEEAELNARRPQARRRHGLT